MIKVEVAANSYKNVNHNLQESNPPVTCLQYIRKGIRKLEYEEIMKQKCKPLHASFSHTYLPSRVGKFPPGPAPASRPHPYKTHPEKGGFFIKKPGKVDFFRKKPLK